MQPDGTHYPKWQGGMRNLSCKKAQILMNGTKPLCHIERVIELISYRAAWQYSLDMDSAIIWLLLIFGTDGNSFLFLPLGIFMKPCTANIARSCSGTCLSGFMCLSCSRHKTCLSGLNIFGMNYTNECFL